MSAPDTLMPLVSAPWFDADGNPLSVTPLPGLRSEVIQSLECSYPGILSPPMKALLGSCCGLAGTELGSIDFTGCWFLEEPYAENPGPWSSSRRAWSRPFRPPIHGGQTDMLELRPCA